ncbi:hypothetical protein, partial [Paenibacillus algorifonticola]|uniref:hypothetical protein n=1 Tax=Paenibacillus algorifonticola TaxID=684063 RepID=UPI0006191297
PKAESWFAGGITHVDIEMEDGIPHVKVEALSRTYAMDLEPKNRSYQNKHLTYTDAILQLVKNYPRGDAQNRATSDQATIGSLMVQFEETDWQFLKRLASRVGTVILPDVVMDTPRVYFGVPDLSWGKELKAKRYTVLKNRAAYEELKAHAEGIDADRIHEADFVSYRITSEQFCQVGDDVVFKKQMWVVAESVISYASGLLTYEYVLVRRQTLRRKSRQNEGIQGVSLEGRVVKRANNMVKVHLDIDNAHDEQGNWWFPYSGEGNNMFHVLPDEGARIKVYFPNGVEKKAMAINSVRGGSEEMKNRTVFQKPTTKVFESPGAAKMQLGDDGVLFEKGTVSLHLDGGNIKVNASEDVLLVAGNKVELGSGSEKGILESIRMRATNQVALQTNADHYVLISDNRVGIKSGKLDFQKVEVPFTELLTDEEIEQMYINEQVEAEVEERKLFRQADRNVGSLSPESYKDQIRAGVEAKVKADPTAARSWMSGLTVDQQRSAYENRNASSSNESKDKGKKDKEAEQAKQQQRYDQQDRDRTAVYQWKKEAVAIREKGEKEGKSQAEIESMLPALPVLSASGSQESGLSGMIHQALNTPDAQHFLELIAPMADAWALENVIPQKPEYLSKQTVKTVYLSRYTYQELELNPQILMAQMNIVFGTVAIVLAIGTGGGSLYVLAIADGVLGAAMVTVNGMKAYALSHGNVDTPLLDLEQKILDDIGITLAVVNLALLLKHGVYTVANKMANGRNIAAVDDAWKAFKLDNVTPPKPKEPPELPKTKPKTKEPSKGGPGVNQPIDEFNDAAIYQGAGKGRPEPPSATGGKVEGTGQPKPVEPRGEPNVFIPAFEAEITALKIYDRLRETGLDTKELEIFSKNTGLSLEEATAVKKHLFLTKHVNLVDENGKYYYEGYFTPDYNIAYGWGKALKTELSSEEKAWFRQLADHELEESKLMQQGEPIRKIESWKGVGSTGDPPGAHDLASPQPDEFPEFVNKNEKYINTKMREILADKE